MLQRGQIQSIQTPGRNYLPEDNAIILSVETSMANQYIRDLSKNVKRGLMSKVEKGWLPCIAPHGYLNTRHEGRGRNYIVKDPDRFPLLRRAWLLMLSGRHSPSEIRDRLNNEWGFRTRKTPKTGGKLLALSTLYSIFKNPFYTGLLPYRGELFAGKHEPMVTADDFDRVQVLLGRPTRATRKRHAYAYTGLIRCGDCGGPISATHQEKRLKETGKVKAYDLYYCISSRRGRRPCSQGLYTNVETLESEIRTEIEKFTILPEFRDLALEVISESAGVRAEEQETVHEAQKKAIETSESQLDRLTGLRLRDLVDDEEYLRQKQRLKAQIGRIHQKLEATTHQEESFTTRLQRALNFACHASWAFQYGNAETKRAIASAIGLNWRLKDHRVRFEAAEWLLPLEDNGSAGGASNALVELGQKRDAKRRKSALAAVRPVVCALVEAIRTSLIKTNPRIPVLPSKPGCTALVPYIIEL